MPSRISRRSPRRRRKPLSTNALAKRPIRLPVKARKLKPEDVSDAKLSTISRAQVLAYPQAATVAQWLADNKGRPLGNRVLILPLPQDDHYGRIIIPATTRDTQCVGIVVAVGKDAQDVRVGNYVVFRKYSNSTVKLGEVDVYQVSASDITFALG